jgi:hypothetical protein
LPSRNAPALLLLSALALTACASPAPAAPAADTEPHGYVEGAAEATEPQLTLATVDDTGSLALLDLVEGGSVDIAELEGVTAVSTDGRYVFASAPGDVTIVDTGVWAVDHEDHAHYYRAEPAVVGTVEGKGEAVVSGGGSVTVVSFTASGEGILLDRDALDSGEVDEVARVDGELFVPTGDAVLAAAGDEIVAYDASGAPIDGGAPCTDPAGTITTRVGVVFGCADGAVLVTGPADALEFELVPYPEAVAPADRATGFSSRPGRPTVAAVAGSSGAWLLDTRERTWTRLATEMALLRVSAADDRDGNVVALAADGRVVVLDPLGGTTVAATAPLLAATVADPALLAGVELAVDANRAYVNAPAEGVVVEIDYADGARVAREFPAPGAPLFLVQTGGLS